jgi:hypothetical protein
LREKIAQASAIKSRATEASESEAQSKLKAPPEPAAQDLAMRFASIGSGASWLAMDNRSRTSQPSPPSELEVALARRRRELESNDPSLRVEAQGELKAAIARAARLVNAQDATLGDWLGATAQTNLKAAIARAAHLVNRGSYGDILRDGQGSRDLEPFDKSLQEDNEKSAEEQAAQDSELPHEFEISPESTPSQPSICAPSPSCITNRTPTTGHQSLIHALLSDADAALEECITPEEPAAGEIPGAAPGFKLGRRHTADMVHQIPTPTRGAMSTRQEGEVSRRSDSNEQEMLARSLF